LADDPRQKFTGKERDTESGLDYFGARYFSAAQGRFTSPDWSEKPEPVPYADLEDPQTLNLYGYVRNNPLAKADADGHCATLCTAAIGFVLGGVVGGGWEAGKQLLTDGKVSNWKAVGASALGGAVSGGLAGLTLGTSAGLQAGYLATGAVSGAANVVGGGVTRAVNGDKVVDAKAATVDFVAGAAGGVAAKKVAGAVVESLVPSSAGQKAVSGTLNPSAYDTVYTTAGNRSVDSVQKVVQSSSNAAGNAVSSGAAQAMTPPQQKKKDQ